MYEVRLKTSIKDQQVHTCFTKWGARFDAWLGRFVFRNENYDWEIYIKEI